MKIRTITLASLILATITLIPSGMANAWSTTQLAKTACSGEIARIDWSFSSQESTRKIMLTVKDSQTNKKSETITIEPNETVTGSFTWERRLSNGAAKFDIKWADGAKGFETRTANYPAIDCRIKTSVKAVEVTTPTRDDLPNTGPVESIGIFSALVAGSLAAWMTTRRELLRALKR
jgi:hypothetical protein